MTTTVLCAGSFRLTAFVDRTAGQGKCPVCLSWVSATLAGMVWQHMTLTLDVDRAIAAVPASQIVEGKG